MTSFRLPYIKRMRDRHGQVRHYYNRPGFPRTALPGQPGTREFMDAYERVHNGTPEKLNVGAGRTIKGSVNELLARFYQSTQWGDLKPETRKNYRRFYEKFRETPVGDTGTTCGDNLVKNFRRAHIAKIIDGLKATPGEARNMRNRLRTLFNYAITPCEYRDDNPATLIAIPKPRSNVGFVPWSDADIEAFKARWPLGTKPYLALMILLRTAVRRSDAHRLGRQHVAETPLGPELQFRSVKGDIEMRIPIDAQLQEALDLVPKTQLIFVLTEYGQPFSAAGFTSWFVKRAIDAGLTDRTPHGLRKAAARHLAESDATPHEIMSVDGHQTLKEVERYTRSANRSKMAWAAVAKRTKAGA